MTQKKINFDIMEALRKTMVGLEVSNYLMPT
jgi:hypothetical protein